MNPRRIMFKWLFVGCAFLLVLTGCEMTKKILGTSTQALQEARVDAFAKTYQCSFNECYEAVLALQRINRGTYSLDQSTELLDHETYRRDQSQPVAEGDGIFDIFQQDRVRGIIVVMGIKGNVDTTEVGIFFDKIDASQTRIEVSSLSSTAKRKVADGIFAELDNRFNTLP